jgi:hypothetical protein
VHRRADRNERGDHPAAGDQHDRAVELVGVTSGTNATGGNIEYLAEHLQRRHAASVPGASDSLYDWATNQTPATGNTYGSMQVHNHDAGEVIFAFNHWGVSGAGQLGIGKQPGHAAGLDIPGQRQRPTPSRRCRSLRARQPMVPPRILCCAAQGGGTSVVVYASKPLAAGATNAANYSIGGLTVLSADLDPTDRMRIVLTTSAQAPGTRYTVTFSGLSDITAEALPMAEGTTADFMTTSPPGLGALNNVPGARNYTLVYSIALSNAAAFNSYGVPYDVDNRAGVGEFSRVAYYLELVQEASRRTSSGGDGSVHAGRGKNRHPRARDQGLVPAAGIEPDRLLQRAGCERR